MFKRMIFAELLVAASVLPAFSAGFDRNATGENACVADYLGVSSGNTVLQAKWKPKIYSFVLDDSFYSPENPDGVDPTTPSNYESVYTRYQSGVYGNAEGAYEADDDYKIEWIRIPEKTGYVFMGFFTQKYGGTQMIRADGYIKPAVQNTLPVDISVPQTLYAQWIPNSYSCPAGQYLNVSLCADCPDGSYCPGVVNVTYDGNVHGLNVCDASAYYMSSDNGRDEITDCYRTKPVYCAEVNPAPKDSVVTYNNPEGVAMCKQYYGSGSNDCALTDETACDTKTMTCNTGYVLDQTGTSCVVAKIKCEPGKYLPAHTNECVICTEDHYCPGTESINVFQDYDQGINPCTDANTGGLRSPAGSQMAADCGVILHVDGAKLYLHADKVTTPSFVTEVGGKKWYGNMTMVTSTCEKTISPDTTKTWHVDRDGDEYTVHGRYVKSAACGDEVTD